MSETALPHTRLRDKLKAARSADPHGRGYGTLKASQMTVCEMRQILVWPLALAHPSFRPGPASTPNAPHLTAAEIARDVAEMLEAEHRRDAKSQPLGEAT